MSMVLKRYSYRAYPVPAQVTPIARLFGCCRVAYNDAIAARRAAWADDGRRMSYNELSARLTAVKKTPERAWLTEVSSVPLQQAVRHADRAHSNFVASITGKRKGARMGARMGEPRFKKRSNRQAAEFTTSGFGHLTSTTHGVGFVTLVQEPDGRYYVSFVVDEPTPAAPPHESTRVAGMDVGLTDLAAIAYSDGSREKVANPRFLRSRDPHTPRQIHPRRRVGITDPATQSRGVRAWHDCGRDRSMGTHFPDLRCVRHQGRKETPGGAGVDLHGVRGPAGSGLERRREHRARRRAGGEPKCLWTGCQTAARRCGPG